MVVSVLRPRPRGNMLSEVCMACIAVRARGREEGYHGSARSSMREWCLAWHLLNLSRRDLTGLSSDSLTRVEADSQLRLVRVRVSAFSRLAYSVSVCWRFNVFGKF